MFTKKITSEVYAVIMLNFLHDLSYIEVCHMKSNNDFTSTTLEYF